MATDFSKAQTVKESLEIMDGGVKRGALISYNGDPNANVTGTVGAMCIDYSGSGKIWKNTDGSTTWADISSGASGAYAPINYITNFGAETSITGWNAYADSLSSTPQDGTGGSPVVTVTRSTSSPLRGAGSVLITKSSGDLRANGASYDFTIDSADQTKILSVSFDYIVGSGTFTAGSSSALSDITVWLYDITNAVLIQPTEYKLYSNSTTVPASFIGTFQTAANSTSYRLILNVSTANTSAWTLKIDNVVVGPVLKTVTSAVGSTISYTPSSSIANTSGNLFKYQRIGDLCKMSVGLNFTGTGASTYTLAEILPPGLSIDYDKLGKLTGTTPDRAVVGFYTAVDVGTASYANIVYLIEGTEFSPIFLSSYFTPGNTDGISMTIEVPIAGWGSNVELNSMDSNRPVHAQAGGTPSDPGTNNPIVFPTVIKDTHAAYNSSTGEFKAPSTGWFKMRGYINISNSSIVFKSYIDGSSTGRSVGISNTVNNGQLLGFEYLRSGQIWTIRPNSGTGVNGSDGWIAFSKEDSATQIGANEPVAASYYSSSNAAISASVQINFDTKIDDTHNAVTTGAAAWKFTAPVSGLYRISGRHNSASGTGFWIQLYKNGSLHMGHVGYVDNDGVTTYSAQIRLNAGDYIDLRGSVGSTIAGGALNTGHSRIEISRIN